MAENQKPTVKVFSTETCPWCFRVKDFLKENNISFEDIDVSTDRESAKQMIQASGEMGVPQIWVGSGEKKKVIVGFDESALKKALGLK